MARVTRYRTRSSSLVGTGKTSSLVDSNVKTWSLSETNSDSCSDSHGRPVVASSFDSTQVKGHMQATGYAISEYYADSVGWRLTLDQYPVWKNATLSGTPLPAPSGWFLSVVAGTNPSRPVVTIPTLLQDLIEIPKQIRDLGRLFHKPKSLLTPQEVASQFLAVKFGWMPLIEDLRQLLTLQSYILKRNKELHQLYSGKGLRRRLKFDTQVTNEALSFDVALYGPNNWIKFPIDLTIEKKSWATISWYPNSVPNHHPSDEELHRLATRIAWGLTPEGLAKGLWDVIPWTWLLGWFTNIGKYALAYSNTVPASHSEACFMSESKATFKSNGVIPINVRKHTMVASGSRTGVIKTRIVSGSLTPGFNMPYLDMSRLSVLSALFVQRIPRWRPRS